MTRAVDSKAVAKPIAEIVSASITGFTAECFQEGRQEPDFPEKPRFGSFLSVDSQESGIRVLGVVCDVSTGPQDNVHTPSALGLTRSELQLEQPQIFSLLKTVVSARTVGYSIADRVFQHLPPQPPDVHDFVYQAEAAEVMKLTSGFEYLRVLTDVTQVPADELLAATIREAWNLGRSDGGLDEEFLVQAGRKLSSLLRSDYDRLLSVLRKIKP